MDFPSCLLLGYRRFQLTEYLPSEAGLGGS